MKLKTKTFRFVSCHAKECFKSHYALSFQRIWALARSQAVPAVAAVPLPPQLVGSPWTAPLAPGSAPGSRLQGMTGESTPTIASMERPVNVTTSAKLGQSLDAPIALLDWLVVWLVSCQFY